MGWMVNRYPLYRRLVGLKAYLDGWGKPRVPAHSRSIYWVCHPSPPRIRICFIISDFSLGYTTLSWDSYINYKSYIIWIKNVTPIWLHIIDFCLATVYYCSELANYHRLFLLQIIIPIWPRITVILCSHIHCSEYRLILHIWVHCLTLCQSNLNPYCMGRKAVFFSVGI
jgi:hypothetical protein